MRYRYNSACPCPRCRAHGFMGPAVLITVGVLFLLDQMGRAHWMDFGFTWPALLIVIGLVMLLQHSASMEGHIPREYGPPPTWQQQDPRYSAQPPYQGQPYKGQPYPGQAPQGQSYSQPPVVTPPSQPTAGFIAPGAPPKGPDEQGGA
ncbi:MAG TPA: DUF5668 domain-containing protein [Bryocella sp.]|nr:DUF5668 domain-containing protein [Bryocella sp.]